MKMKRRGLLIFLLPCWSNEACSNGLNIFCWCVWMHEQMDWVLCADVTSLERWTSLKWIWEFVEVELVEIHIYMHGDMRYFFGKIFIWMIKGVLNLLVRECLFYGHYCQTWHRGSGFFYFTWIHRFQICFEVLMLF